LVRGMADFPLDADSKWMIDCLYCLDDSVLRPAGCGEFRADLTDRLMVVAGSLGRVLAEDLGDVAAGFQVQAMSAESERFSLRAMAIAAGDLGQMLVQRASAMHIEQLHAAADGQNGESDAERLLDEGQFGGVHDGAARTGPGVRGAAIQRRVH